MRLATIRRPGGTRAARIEDSEAVLLESSDVGALLGTVSWRDVAASSDGPRVALERADLAPVVPRPSKIVCVGLNYAPHIREMGRELPDHPTLFAKYPEALIGPRDVIRLPPESDAVDWEGELAVVIGAPVRRADLETARLSIAGFTILNDVTMRDWQYRTTQWLQGKTFEASSPLGPVLVTPDELPGGARPECELRTWVGQELVQSASTTDLLFDPVDLVAYVSTILTLLPGDLLSTGTPGGVGHVADPPRHLEHGMVLVTEIAGIGRCENPVRGTAGDE